MLNFNYVAYCLGSIYQFIIVWQLLEISYVTYNKLVDSGLIVRIIAFILFGIMYCLAITAYVFIFMNTTITHSIVLTAIMLFIDVLCFIFSIVSKNHSSFPVAILCLINAMSFVYSQNFDFTPLAYAFNQNTYYAFAAIANVICLISIIIINTTELSLKPLFGGIIPQANPEFGPLLSTD
jgi:hypothetical protein